MYILTDAIEAIVCSRTYRLHFASIKIRKPIDYELTPLCRFDLIWLLTSYFPPISLTCLFSIRYMYKEVSSPASGFRPTYIIHWMNRAQNTYVFLPYVRFFDIFNINVIEVE